MAKLAILFLTLSATVAALASPAIDRRQHYSLEAKSKVTNPLEIEFLNEVIAQLGLTITGVANILTNTEQGIQAIISPGGEVLANEIKYIVGIAGIRYIEIIEPLLLILKPIFPEPKFRAISDLIKDLEDILGVPMKELQDVMQSTVVQLDQLSIQVVSDIVAVAAKLGPKAQSQMDVLLQDAVKNIKEEIRPLWDLFQKLFPKSSMFSAKILNMH